MTHCYLLCGLSLQSPLPDPTTPFPTFVRCGRPVPLLPHFPGEAWRKGLPVLFLETHDLTAQPCKRALSLCLLSCEAALLLSCKPALLLGGTHRWTVIAAYTHDMTARP